MSLHPRAESAEVVRLAHLSDIHVTVPRLGWRLRDWLGKRATGWMNLHWFGRAGSFRLADHVLTTLAKELEQRQPNHVVFSGDASTLGFEAEIAHAATLLGAARADGLPGLAVPGNHDFYTPAAARSGAFERLFSRWQQGERVDAHTYPFAQRVGPVWLVGVNSCTGNVWPWDAAGRVGREQLQRLELLLNRLGPGPRILVTHYPVCLSSGEPEHSRHGLRDLAEVLKVARQGHVCLWLHGHRHGAYHHACSTDAPFPILCAGTATQEGRWSYGAYTVTGWQLQAVRRVYSPVTGSFEDGEVFELQLPNKNL